MAIDTFQEKYCDIAREYLAQGHSLDALAAKLKCSRITVYNWKEKHKNFEEAIEEGFSSRTGMVEDILTHNAKTGQGGAAVAIFLAKNWASMKDKTEVDNNISGSISLSDLCDRASKTE